MDDRWFRLGDHGRYHAQVKASMNAGNSTTWLPPESPNPSEILHSAVEDRRAGRFSIALEKHVWYHANALKYAPAQYGVRLSYALGYWYELANQYPPALAAFIAHRDNAVRGALEEAGQTAYEFFHDAAKFNNELEDYTSTSQLFLKLGIQEPEFARTVYKLAQDSLIQTGNIETCDHYLDAELATSRLIDSFRRTRDWNPTDGRAERRNMAVELIYKVESGNVIAILASNGHKDAAKRIAGLILQEWDDKKLAATVEQAMLGIFPNTKNA